jgi:hypothetical protein
MTQNNNDLDIAETFKGYSTFIEVENRMLRAYNQWSVLSNMKESKLYQFMEDYINKLSKEDRLGLHIISEYIKAKGLEETKRELISEGVFA